MHRQRLLSALLLVPPFLLLVRFGSPFHFALLVVLAVGVGAWEFSRLCPAGADTALSVLTVVGAVGWVAGVGSGRGIAGVGAAMAGITLLWVALLQQDFRLGVMRAAWVLLGIAYVGGLLGFAVELRDLPEGKELMYFLLFTTWAGDIAAYYVGRRFGEQPLAPRISPKKTVEGALGGLTAAIVVGIAGSSWVWPRLAPGRAAVAALILGMVGILGDLCESAVKRGAGVKDSGCVIPGHGGILDRLDSLMFACPMLYALVHFRWV